MMKLALLVVATVLLLVTHLESLATGAISSSLSTPSPTPSPDQTAYWPTQSWRISTPEQQGMDSESLASMFEAIQQQNANIHSITVVRHGYIVTDAYFHPHQAASPHELLSATKSIVSMLVGIAIQEGYIDSENARVVDFFSDRTIANNDERKQKMSLGHLLTMTSGLRWIEESTANHPSLSQMTTAPDWIQFVLDQPMAAEPGTVFNYNSGGPHLLSAILQKTTGMSTFAFAEQALFKPLGISSVLWLSDPGGINDGGGGLQMTPRDMAKIGYLYLHDGTWDGRTVVPAGWVRASTTKHVAALYGQDYGYLWWLPQPGSFAARGHGGQFLSVFPDLDLVVAFTSGMSDALMELPQQLIDAFVRPAVKGSVPLPANPAGVARLQAAIQAVEQPRPKAVPSLPDIARTISGKTYRFEANPAGAQTQVLVFKEQRAWLTLEHSMLGNKPITAEVGLDDVFRITPTGSGSLIAFKGAWQDDKTFILYQQVVGQAERTMVRMTFEGDTVTIQGTLLMDGFSATFAGQMQK